uniref:Uncharacterized protein n=1 Tax=Candidatus Kentrum sp. FW TaxID=2126338 RepID=A0A450T6L5_9GAMM|nr:MAG: hypothetical protein BECKFW1821A_GA0114235_112210 [Candidatus Kentron sp. FW]
METIAKQFPDAFHGILAGFGPFRDYAEHARPPLYEHVRARMQTMLERSADMSRKELDEAIENLERDESGLKGLLLSDPAPDVLELMRDTRWKLMASRAELTHSEPVHTTTSIAELNALFEQELSQ